MNNPDYVTLLTYINHNLSANDLQCLQACFFFYLRGNIKRKENGPESVAIMFTYMILSYEFPLLQWVLIPCIYGRLYRLCTLKSCH